MKKQFFYSTALFFAVFFAAIFLPVSAKPVAFSESFPSGTFPPTGWAISGNASQGWIASQAYSAYPLSAFGDGSFAVFDAYGANAAGLYSVLETPALTVDADSYLLHFSVMEILLNESAIAAGMQLFVDVFDGTTWSSGTGNVLLDAPWHNTAQTPQQFCPITLDLSSLIGNSQVKLRFRAISDYGGFILGLDNVSLSAEPAAMPNPLVKIQGIHGGLWSANASPLFAGGTSLQNAFAQEPVLYFADLFYENAAVWSFSGSHTAIQEINSYKKVGVGFNDAGAHTATITATGINSQQATDNFSSTLRLATEGLSDYVWNVSASDDQKQLVIKSTGTSYHYIHGLSSGVKRIAETYSIPGNTSVTINRIGMVIGRYSMSSQGRAVIIRIGQLAADGTPGEVIKTFNSTFTAVLGSASLTTGAPQERTFSLPETVTVQGAFFVELDFSSVATVNSSNSLGIMGTTYRPYSYTTSYVFPAATGKWTPVNEVYAGANSSAAILVNVTYHTLSCAAPLLPKANPQATTATLSWTENNSATSWEIEYGTAGFTRGTGTKKTVTTNPYLLENLQSETQYEYYVRSLCDSQTQSEWSKACAFTTTEETVNCEVATLPLKTGFEEVIPCWTWAYSSSDPEDAPGRSTEEAYNGNYSWKFSSYNTTNSLGDHDGDAWLISPELPVDKEKNITFFYKKGGYNDRGAETLKAGYSTTNNSPASFIWLDEITDASDAWQKFDKPEIKFPEEAKYIAIFYASDFKYFVFVDEVEVSQAIGTGVGQLGQSGTRVYPVISKGNICIETEKEAKVTIYSALGKKVKVLDSIKGKQMIDLEGRNGLYLISVEAGNSIETFKVVLQR